MWWRECICIWLGSVTHVLLAGVHVRGEAEDCCDKAVGVVVGVNELVGMKL